MEEKKKEKKGKKKGEIFSGWAGEKKKKNPPQCLVWFRLNGLGQVKWFGFIPKWTHPLERSKLSHKATFLGK